MPLTTKRIGVPLKTSVLFLGLQDFAACCVLPGDPAPGEAARLQSRRHHFRSVGRPLFHCPQCGAPITHLDFAQLGLRLPDIDECASDYFDAEVIDSLSHFDCPMAARAAS
jgi:hypothetical protein